MPTLSLEVDTVTQEPSLVLYVQGKAFLSYPLNSHMDAALADLAMALEMSPPQG